MIEFETLKGNEAYTMDALFSDLRTGIFSELRSGKAIDTYRRNLQRAYVERLEYLMTKEQSPVPGRFAAFAGYTPIDVSQSDIRPVAKAHLKALKGQLQSASMSDSMSKYHVEDLVDRIDEILDTDD